MTKTSTTLAALSLGAAATLASLPAQAGKDLDAIKKRGELVCGVGTGLAGFSAADSQGRPPPCSTTPTRCAMCP